MPSHVLRIAFRGFSLLAALIGSGCVPPPQPVKLPDLGGRTVVVAVQATYPPFSQTDPQTGQAVGWDYDTMNELGRRLNFSPQYVIAAREDIIPGVAAGRYDLAADGISFTLDRQQQVDFPAFYLVVEQRLMIRQGDTRAATMVAFKKNASLLVGTLAGSTNFDAAVAFFGAARVTGFVTIDGALQALLSNTVDAVLLDDATYRAVQTAHAQQVTRLPGTLRNDVLGFIVTLGSDLGEPIQQAFDSMVTDGTAATIDANWGLAPATAGG